MSKEKKGERRERENKRGEEDEKREKRQRQYQLNLQSELLMTTVINPEEGLCSKSRHSDDFMR